MEDRPEIRAAIEHNHRRIWALCYRMTGRRMEADDLSQEAIARAMERADQLADPSNVDGWLFRIATTVCLDHARRKSVERRLTELVDPVDFPDLPLGERGPDHAAVLRQDLRYAVVVALQRLSPKQRAVIVLHDVCDCSADEVGIALGTNANAVKSLLHRARAALTSARRTEDVDVPVDRRVVEKMAAAIEAGSIEALEELFAKDVWGLVDGGGVVQTSNRPNFGRRAVARQWANAKRRLGLPVVAEVRSVNGEPAVLVRVPALDRMLIAAVHLETRDGQVVALRVNRDPASLRYLLAA
jgi:RNA polymerase sigma-70 factor (ECF subfamily)